MRKWYKTPNNECLVCQKPDDEKPMTFRGTDHCSDDHRKVISGEYAQETHPDEFRMMVDFVNERFNMIPPKVDASRQLLTRRVCDPETGESRVQYYDADEDSWYWTDTDVRVDE